MKRRFLSLVAGVFFVSSGVYADASRALFVATRSSGFIEDADGANTKFAVLHDPSSPASQEDLAEIRAQYADGVDVGGGKVPLDFVDVSNEAAWRDYRFVFLTSGLEDAWSRIGDVATESHIVTISQEAACVEQGHCVMAVLTGSRMQILVSIEAAARAAVEFKAAFRMLVREL